MIAQHGPTLLSDDYGDDRASAYGLGEGDVTVERLVTSRTDLDVFAVTRSCSGTLSATLTPAALGPDLDTRLRLLDAPARSSPSSAPATARGGTWSPLLTGMGAAVAQSVGPGTYYLEVDGTGLADPDPRLQRLRLGRPLLAVRHRLPGLGPHRDGAEPHRWSWPSSATARRTGSASSGTPPPTTVARRSPRTS